MTRKFQRPHGWGRGVGGEGARLKPSVGQLVSVVVREHLQALKSVTHTARPPDAPPTEPDQPPLKAALAQLVEEHIRPLREQVRRLEAELHGVASGRE